MEVIHTRNIKEAAPVSKKAARLAAIRATPFAKLSDREKDFLLQEVAVRLGLLPARSDDT
jgi:hypothetical protein